jgi:hypothetical protein
MTGVRNRIAERLGYEAKRKGLKVRVIAERAHLPETVVRRYFNARREISFAELTPLCDTFALAPMRLLGKHFDKSRLAFRKVTAVDGRIRPRAAAQPSRPGVRSTPGTVTEPRQGGRARAAKSGHSTRRRNRGYHAQMEGRAV